MKFPDDLVEVVARAILSTRLGAGFDQDYVDESWGKFTDEANAALTAFVGWAGKPENVTERMLLATAIELAGNDANEAEIAEAKKNIANNDGHVVFLREVLAAANRALGEP